MTIPKFDDVRDDRLVTDEQVLQRVASLLERAVRRQLWLLFLDEQQRQLPVIMPSYVPRSPDDGELERFAGFLGVLFEDVDAEALIVVYERRGRDELSEPDRRWLRFVDAACRAAAVPVRGPLLLHDRGVRWLIEEDWAPVRAG